MRYRRVRVPGGSWFFTVVTEGRRPLFKDPATVGVLREAFRAVRATRPFRVEAVVVLPDHLHCIWTLPPGDADFATRWRLVKTWFTKHVDPSVRGVSGTVRSRKGERALWQRRYWEHLLRDEADRIGHVEYIHFNPVKHGYARSPAEWPFSSFHRAVAAGVYPADWGEGVSFDEGVGRE